MGWSDEVEIRLIRNAGELQATSHLQEAPSDHQPFIFSFTSYIFFNITFNSCICFGENTDSEKLHTHHSRLSDGAKTVDEYVTGHVHRWTCETKV